MTTASMSLRFNARARLPQRIGARSTEFLRTLTYPRGKPATQRTRSGCKGEDRQEQHERVFMQCQVRIRRTANDNQR